MSKHTPEPWKTIGLCVRVGTPPNHEWIAQACCPNPSTEDYANIERTVACVNACQGGNPEAVPMMVEALRKLCAMLPQELDTVDGRHAFAMHLKKGRAALAKWEEV